MTKGDTFVLRNILKDQFSEVRAEFPMVLNKIIKPQPQFNAGPLFVMNGYKSTYLCKIEPSSNRLKEYKDLPDITDKSLFIVLNNDEDETKYENVIQINAIRADESVETEGEEKKNKKGN